MTSRTAGLLGCLLLLFLVAGLAGMGLMLLGTFGDDGFPGLGGKVGLVRLSGPISDSRAVVRHLAEMQEDDAIKAVVLRIDSPGGGIAPSQEIHDAVLRLRDEKPVVASMGNTAASGGYYVAVACDSIVANPGTLTGSIGVIFSWVTAEELLRKVGVKMQVFKSGDVKDVGSFAREPSDEERALLSGVVDDAYRQFVDAVAAGRTMSTDQVRALADGRIFTGRQALDLGLVDRLGGEYEAVQLAAAMGGIEGKPEVVDRSTSPFRLLEMLEESSRLLVPGSQGPRLEYSLR